MSQRESYQYPSGGSGGGGSGSGYSGFNSGPMTGVESSGSQAVSYICGECASKVLLGKGDTIRCSSCGHRVLYKERTKRLVQFEAR